jgi:hypothetical protein
VNHGSRDAIHRMRLGIAAVDYAEGDVGLPICLKMKSNN